MPPSGRMHMLRVRVVGVPWVVLLLLLDMSSLTRTTAAVEHRPSEDCDIVAHRALGPTGPPISPCARAYNSGHLPGRDATWPHAPAKSRATTSKKSSRAARSSLR